MSATTLRGEARRPERALGDAVRALGGAQAVALTAVLVLAAVLRFYRIGHQGFWFDEANASADMRYSPGKMLGLLPSNQTTPPFYYLVGWVWGRVFGFSEAPLRSLSALVGVGAVALGYVAGRRLVSPRAGLIAAALAACNPFLIWYSQEARPYEMLVFFAAASLVAFSYARERPSPRTLTWWGAIAALALATHYYALLVVIPEALWLLWLHGRHRSVQVASVVVGAIGIALLPLAIAQNHTGNASWIHPIPLLGRLGAIVPQFLIGFQATGYQVMLRISEAIVLGALIALAWRAEPDERRGALQMGAIVVAGLVLNLLLVAVGIDDLITRNVIALWLPAALLVAGGLGARRAGWLWVAGAAALCTMGVVAVAGVAFNREFQRPDWRGVARVLGAEPNAGVDARAILIQHYHYLLPLSLYVHGLGAWPGRQASVRVDEIDIVSIQAPRVNECWYGAACNLSGSPMQSAYPIAGFHELWRRRVYQFTVMRLVSPAPVALTERAVAHALWATTFRRDELLLQR